MKCFKSLLIFLLLTTAVNLHIHAQQLKLKLDSLRTVLPVTIKYDDKMVTPFVNIKVDGKLLKAIFDTGSSGLRILSGALITMLNDTLNKRVSYSYGDKSHKLGLKGSVHLAMISFDSLNTFSAVPVMCVDSAKYNPNCDWIAIGDSAVIKSKHFRGCAAILGVGLRRGFKLKGVESPLNQVPGNGKFIVMFPGYGGSKGSVIINPAPEDELGFTFFQLTPEKLTGRGWNDNKLAACIVINAASACLPTLLDSGNPDIQVFLDKYSGIHAISSRNYVTLRVGGLTDSVFTEAGFTVGDERFTGKDYVYLDEADKEQKMVFGIGFFFRFDVLYDQQNGLIGIRKKLRK